MTAIHVCEYLWIGFFVVWVIWGFKTKAVQQRESVSSRLSYTLFTFAAYYMMFAGDVPREWLRVRVFAPNAATNAIGIAITIAGIAFAIWARIYLGGNWSSSVTVKVGHQLIRTGPYRFVRHPIYTGLIVSLLGTAVVRHQVRGLVAVVLAYVGFKLKSKIEERTMTTTFGAQYDDYARTTGAIVPRLWP